MWLSGTETFSRVTLPFLITLTSVHSGFPKSVNITVVSRRGGHLSRLVCASCVERLGFNEKLLLHNIDYYRK